MKLLVATRIIVAGILVAFSISTSAYAAAYLKIEGIDGESATSTPDGMPLDGFTLGVSSPDPVRIIRGRPVASGKVNMQDMTVTKRIDKATPILMKACAEGKHFEKAELTVRMTSTEPPRYYKVTMKDLLISSYSSTGGGDVPSEELSLSFASVDFSFVFPASDGSPDQVDCFSWDVKSSNPR